MARSHMRYVVRDRGGNAIANSLVHVYLKGTTTAVSDMFAAESGGAAITTLTSNTTGEIEAWMDAPKFVDLKITDNSNAAYNPGAVGTLDFADQTETVEVVPRPEEVAQLDETQTWTATQTFAAIRGTTARFSLEPAANVKHPTYGALGDGSNDDTAEIQAALTAAKEVFIPDGTYMLSAALVPTSGQRVVLSQNAVLKFTAAATGGIPIFSIGDGITDVVIEGGVLDGNKAANATPTSGLYGIIVQGTAARIRIRGVHARNFPSSASAGVNGGDGFYIGKTDAGVPNDVRLVDCSASDCVRQGVSVVAGTRIRLVRPTVTGITGTTGGNGVNVEPAAGVSCDDIVIANPVVYSCSKGIGVGNNFAGSLLIDSPVVHDITDATNGNGINVGDCTGDIVIANPSIEACAIDGIQLGTVPNVRINGGTIRNVDRYGIRMQGPRQSVTGTTIIADTDNPVRLENAAANCAITGCTFYVTGNFGAVRSESTNDHVITANQMFATATGAAVRLLGTTSGAVVVGNRGEGFLTGLELAAGTSLNRAEANDFTGCTTPLTDAGTNNVIAGSHSVAGVWQLTHKALVAGELELDGAFNHDGTTVGFYGVAPATRPAATDDIKDALTTLGLLQGTSASPLNLDGGALTAATGSFSGDVTTATVQGAVRRTVGPFFVDNAAASQTDIDMNLVGSANRTKRVAVRAGSVTGIAVRSNEARTAGTLTAEVTVNGAATGLTAVLDGTNTTFKVTTQATGADAYVAGDELGIKWTSDGSWAPTTADLTAEIEVVE